MIDSLIVSVISVFLIRGVVELTVGETICIGGLCFIFLGLLLAIYNTLGEIEKSLEEAQKRLEKIRDEQLGNQGNFF